MAYEPTTWARGTKISAQKLNNIEQGVQSVNSEYTPTTWAEGDIVTATKLNNIEQGIANASGGGGGGGDFSTAEVTLKSSGNFGPEVEFIEIYFPVVPALLPPPNDMAGTVNNYYLEDGEITYNAILYKNACYFAIGNLLNTTVVTSGNIENLGMLGYKITGDCVIEFVGTYE